MAAKLRALTGAGVALLLLGCSSPWDSEQPEPTVTTVRELVTMVASATSERFPTPTPTPTPTAPPSPSPTPVLASPTAAAEPGPTMSPPTPTSLPEVVDTVAARCCGVFSWIDEHQLLVFDDPAQDQSGAWVIDVLSGSRQRLASNFGLPSASGLVAFPDRAAGHTVIRRVDGSLVATVDNGGGLTWISPDGQHLAWLEDLGGGQTSSLVPRTVRLWRAGIDGSAATRLLEFRAAELRWLPDSRHIIALAHAPDSERPGIWVVDTETGTNGVVVDGSFLQALQLSPDGSRMAYLATFSNEPSQDGVWVANTDGSNRIHLTQTGSFRWGGDAALLWLLELAPRAGGSDVLVQINLADDSVVERIDLGGRVQNDQWEVSPNGRFVAFWNEADQTVMLKALPG